MLRLTHEAGEQVVRAQVLERGEALAEGAHVVDRQSPALAVEAGDSFPDGEVARGPGPRRREAAKLLGETGQRRVARGEAVKLVEVELSPEQLADDRLGRRVQRLDLDAAGRGLDAHFASIDDPVQAAFVPEVRQVGAEGPV